MASTVGSIGLEVYADIAQMSASLTKAEREIRQFTNSAGSAFDRLTNFAKGFGTGLARLGIAVGGVQLANLAKQAIAAADDIGDLADRLDISTDALQAFQFAARDVGAGAEALTTGIGKLNKTLGEAGAGNKEAIESFKQMGVAFQQGGYLRATEDVIRSIADRIQKAGSTAEQTRIAVEAFGKGGAALVPIFRQGAAGLDELLRKLREMGVIIDSEALGKADALQKKFDQLASTIQTTTIKAVLAFSDALGGHIESTRKEIEWIGRLIDSVEKLARAPWGDAAERVKNLRAQLQGLSSSVNPGVRKRYEDQLKAAEAALDAENEAKREAAKAAQAGGPKGTPVVVPFDAAAAKKARDAEFQALIDKLEFEETANKAKWEAIDKTREIEKKLAADEREEAYRLLNDKLEFDQKYYEAKWAAIDKTREAEKKLAEDTTEAAYQTLLDQMEFDEKLRVARQEEMEKRNEAVKAEQEALTKRLQPLTEGLTGIFSSVERAFSTSVTGILQGTTTLEKAFANLGESIAVSLVETGVKQGVKMLQDAMKQFLESETFKQFVNMALKFVGSMFGGGVGAGFGTGTGATINATQTFNISGYGPAFAAAGGIVQSPTLTMTGEKGPEAIIPLDRWGEFGGSDVTVNIIDQRQSGNVEQREGTTAAGEKTVDILITDVVRSGLQSGAYDRAMGSSFGVSRRGVSR